MITGKLQINENTIARYEITRQLPYTTGKHDIGKYHCKVTYTDQAGYPLIADFYTNHILGNGPLVLVGKVMLECTQHMKRLPVRE